MRKMNLYPSIFAKLSIHFTDKMTEVQQQIK